MEPVGPYGKRVFILVSRIGGFEGNLFYIDNAEAVLEVLQKRQELIVRGGQSEAYFRGADRVARGAYGERGAPRLGVGYGAKRHIFEREVAARGYAIDVDDKAYVIDVVRQNALELLDIVGRECVALGDELVAVGLKLLRFVERFIKRGDLRLQALYPALSLISVVGVHRKEPYCGGYEYRWKKYAHIIYSESYRIYWVCG